MEQAEELKNWKPMYLPPDFDAQDGGMIYDLMFTDGEQAFRVRECDRDTFDSYRSENFIPKAWAFASDVMPSDRCFKCEKRNAYNFVSDVAYLWHWLFDLRLNLIANMKTTNHATCKWQKALCTVYMEGYETKTMIVTNPHGLQETYTIFDPDPEKEMKAFSEIVKSLEMEVITPNNPATGFW